MIRIALVIVGLLLCVWKFTTGFLAGQDIRTNGETVLFELAPVDPRELFLGDYMTLRYDLEANQPQSRSDRPETARGVAVIRLDETGVAQIVRYDRTDTLAKDERLIRYTQRRWGQPSIGGERYYFQSGTGERYEAARYGIFRVMPDGRALLSGLADAQRRPIRIAGEAPS